MIFWQILVINTYYHIASLLWSTFIYVQGPSFCKLHKHGPVNVQLQQLSAPETVTKHRGTSHYWYNPTQKYKIGLNDLIQLHSVFADDCISLWFLFDYLPLIRSDSFSALILFFYCMDTEIVLLLFKSFKIYRGLGCI